MLKQGLFATNEGFIYTVYEVEEKNYYRIDFVRDSADFNIEPDAVAYSYIRRRKAFEYGDRSIYDAYMSVLRDAHSLYTRNSTKESFWENGKFYQKYVKDDESVGYHEESTLENGVFYSSTLLYNNNTISMSMLSSIFDVKMDPLNFYDYTEVGIIGHIEEKITTPYYPLKLLRQKYDIAHLDKEDYSVCTDIQTFYKEIERFKNSDYPLRGFDTETTGTDVHRFGKDKLVGVILASDPHHSVYFPFRHTEFENLPMHCLKDIADAINEKGDITVAHNKKFDRQVMLNEGYNVHVKWDSMLLSIIVNPTIGKGLHSLKDLVFKLTGKVYLELENIFISNKLIDFKVLPKEIVKLYACPDATNTILVFEELLKQLPSSQYKLLELECELNDIICEQEWYGMRVDVKKYQHQYENCNYVIETLHRAFCALTHETGNIDSADVLRNLIYNKMKCKVLVYTKTNRPSTSAAAISKLASIKRDKPLDITKPILDIDGSVVIKAEALANAKYPVLVILEKYREYMKRKTAFYARFEKTMESGRIYFWVNQYGAATGRQSSPMHQLPPELKEVMLSDSDECDLWGPDYSQIELRMIAYLAGEDSLIKLCSDPNNDIHRVIGSLISNKEMWEITDEERKVGKRRNFGVVYLISKYGLAGQIFGAGYTTENVKFCEEQLNAFYKRFKRIDRYIKANASRVQTRGYMETRIYKRRRYFNEIFDPDITSRRKASLIRQANNVPVQGTAADLLKLALVNMQHYIHSKGWDEIMESGYPRVRLMLSIHDEILISSDKTIPYEEIMDMIASCMEIKIEGAPPFFAEPSKMDNWGQHDEDSLCMPVVLRDKLIKQYKETGVSAFKKSKFVLNVTSTIRNVATANIPIVDKIKQITNIATWTCEQADYVSELTEAMKVEAVTRYVQSNFVNYYPTNYSDIINEYHDEELKTFMEDCIAKAGEDYHDVAQLVRHPSLTFALLDRYAKELKGKDLSHVEKIEEATRLYMLDRNENKPMPEVVLTTSISFERIESEKEKFFEEIEDVVNFDENGEVVYDKETEELENDEYRFSQYDDEEFIFERTTGEIVKVWEIADTILVDMQDLMPADANKVIAEVYKAQNKNGFFKVLFMYDGKTLDPGLQVEELDTKAISDMILELEGVKVDA